MTDGAFREIEPETLEVVAVARPRPRDV